jgi:hypothetical protein
MRRREFITLLGGAAAWPIAAGAQQKFARIGFLRQAGPHEKQFEAFRKGLRAAGCVEGQNIAIEQRHAAGAYDQLNALAMELVRTSMSSWSTEPQRRKPARVRLPRSPSFSRWPSTRSRMGSRLASGSLRARTLTKSAA